MSSLSITTIRQCPGQSSGVIPVREVISCRYTLQTTLQTKRACLRPYITRGTVLISFIPDSDELSTSEAPGASSC
jgi:hypothetical protein